MKCIRYPNQKVARLDDADARRAVRLEGAKYISKVEWKNATGSTEKVTGNPNRKAAHAVPQ